MATIKDVAQMAGVSVTTVSIIINGKSEERQISRQTQERVQQAIQALNYQPSFSARALRSTDAQIFTVGLYWVLDYRSAFLSRFLTGIQTAMVHSKIKMNIVICPYKPNEIHKEKSLYQTNSYNAVIIANLSGKDYRYIHRNPLPMPAVINNRPSDQYHAVFVDVNEIGRKAALHLLERGVTHPAVISMNSDNYAMNNSTSGFIEAYKENGIEIPEENRLFIPYSIESGSHAGEQILDLPSMPDGIFCDSDPMAHGLLYTFNRRGIRVPEDVKIISTGLGNPNYARFSTPSLTTVDIPLEDLGQKCFDIVEQIARGMPGGPAHTELESVLYERESSAAALVKG